ncbi:MAG: alpha/beta hydrolase [Clostridia bacterium]|nr:alpha/beta hydrolase [Clostridia bacterium]
MASLRGRALMSVLRLIFHSPLSRSDKISDRFAAISKKMKAAYKVPVGYAHERRLCDGVAYEVLLPDNRQTDLVLFHLHGGGFKVALNNYYRRTAENYSRLFGGAAVISVDYGTWPANELPSQMLDAVKVYRHLIAEGFLPEKMVFIGDSAGATLAMTACLFLRDHGLPLPRHNVCFSLWGDADSTGDSRIKNAYTDPFYGIAKRKRIEDNLHLLRRISVYVRNADRSDPYISPCRGAFDGFPPTTLFCGTAELDESDSDRVYEKMKAAGVDVRLYKYDGMCHCFQMFAFLPESKDAFKKAVERVKYHEREFDES